MSLEPSDIEQPQYRVTVHEQDGSQSVQWKTLTEIRGVLRTYELQQERLDSIVIVKEYKIDGEEPLPIRTPDASAHFPQCPPDCEDAT